MEHTTIAVDPAKSVSRCFRSPCPIDPAAPTKNNGSPALVALVTDIRRFPSGRHFSSVLGLTPKEDSSGSRRRLGAISKQGDMYVRMLLTHGARSVVWHAHDEPAWLCIDLHFLRKLRLVQQRLWNPNALGIPNADDSRHRRRSDYIVITYPDSGKVARSAG